MRRISALIRLSGAGCLVGYRSVESYSDSAAREGPLISASGTAVQVVMPPAESITDSAAGQRLDFG